MAVRLFLVLTVMVASMCHAGDVTVWVGTTTPRGGLSKGIYRLTLNTETGKLSRSELAAEVSNPGWVTLAEDGKRLYASGVHDKQSALLAYAVDGNELKLINAQPIGDGGAAHVSVNPNNNFLMSAQYGGGSVAVFPLEEDGSIGSRSQLVEHEGGSRVVGNRQNSPHPHWTGYDPQNAFALVPDLGLDAVVIYRIDHKEGTLTSQSVAACPPGGGPRHMKFHPNKKHVFVLNELALSVTTFAFDAAAGEMKQLSTVQTLTDDQKAKESFNSAAEIRVHKSGKFVYTSNRGHDSISVFRHDAGSGQLTLIEVESIRGGWPRNFNIDPTGKWLLAAGRDSNTLAVFAIDQASGELTYGRSVAFVPSPICVAFGK